MTVLEVLFALAVIVILAGVGIATVLSTLDRSRGLGAARYLAGRMAWARAQAVRRSAIVALRFDTDARGIGFSTIQDGNSNGVRTRDIDLQVDRVIDAPTLLADLFPGVEIGLVPSTPATDPVQLGGTTILSFTPTGTSTSGSVYVRGRDGTQWVVRVLGVTARARVLKYLPATNEWVHAD